MGKIAKPQRSKKHKKIKSVDPFYSGNRKDSRTAGLNQVPKNYEQEVPKKLRNLGYTIDGVRGGKVGKKSKNKFHKHPDGPALHDKRFSTPLGAASPKSKVLQPPQVPKKENPEAAEKEVKPKADKKDDKDKRNKRDKKSKISEEVFNEYVDNLKPTRTFVDPFNFKKKIGETEKEFNRRVNTQAQRALTKSKIDDHFEVSDEKRLQQKMIKLKKGMSEKKKQRLKDKKSKKVESIKEKKQEKLEGFNALQDYVEFGEVAHAPPSLSVRPKKAVVSQDVDRPGRRMPELQAMIAANMQESQGRNPQVTARQRGTTVKRRNLTTLQKRQADSNREDAIEAYRSMKKKLKH